MAPHICKVLVAVQLLLFSVTTVQGQTPAPGTGCASSWVGPLQVSFESSLGEWFQDATDNLNWIRRTGITGSSSTGPSSAYHGQYYVYVESSGFGTGYPNKRAILNSPCFDLQNATSADFSFAYHMYGSGQGELDVEASGDEGVTWTRVWNMTGNQGNSWYSVIVDLSGYTGLVLRLRFNAVTGTSLRSDIALDLVSLLVDDAEGPLTLAPTLVPTSAPPTLIPTAAPPTSVPSAAPATIVPTVAPPTVVPTAAPPTVAPPTVAPPTIAPTGAPPTAEPGCAVYWDGPLQVSFEPLSAPLGWFQDTFDDVNWRRISGETTSSSTGPSSAYHGHYYMYVEASSNPLVRAILNSPCFDLQNATSAELSFAYHMYGSSQGQMDVEASVDEGLTWTSVWYRSGNQGNSWRTSTVDLSAYTGLVLRLRFNAVTGVSYRSDVAIDLVSFLIDGAEDPLTLAPPTVAPPTLVPTVAPPTSVPSAAPATQVPSAVPQTAAPATLVPTAVPPTFVPTGAPSTVVPTGAPPTAAPGCTYSWNGPQKWSFELSMGDWHQDSFDDIDWRRHADSTGSSNTGPSSAYNGKYYMYVEASGNSYPSKRAILNSPCYDLQSATAADFSFAYHMYGSSTFGSMALEASSDEGLTWTSVWDKDGNQGNAWRTATVDLSAYTGSVLRLRFNRVTGLSFTSDAAIDYVSLSIDGVEAPFTHAPTFAPTEAPPTLVPTAAPATSVPSAAPLTAAPATVAPTSAPATTVPSAAPATTVPSAAPATTVPSAAPATIAPTSLPTTLAPTAAPLTVAPATATPSSAPPTSNPSAAPPTSIPSAAPATSIPSAAPSTTAPATVAPTSAPATVVPVEAVPRTAPTCFFLFVLALFFCFF